MTRKIESKFLYFDFEIKMSLTFSNEKKYVIIMFSMAIKRVHVRARATKSYATIMIVTINSVE